jgi:ubiquinone/menaquinone biosynthesis C-methylase UbiE
LKTSGSEHPRERDRDQLARLAREIGENWVETPYFDQAEGDTDWHWHDFAFPMIQDCDFSVVLDLAAGHGRNAAKLLELAEKLYIVDVNEENVDFCRRRFHGDARVSFLVCDGISLTGVPDEEITLAYCFDSMVHFDSDVVRAYLGEFRRVLRPGGRGMCHHSNYSANPSADDFRDNPHWRNFMSRELFEHYCAKEGLVVIRSQLIEWGIPDLDCITVFEKPAG